MSKTASTALFRQLAKLLPVLSRETSVTGRQAYSGLRNFITTVGQGGPRALTAINSELSLIRPGMKAAIRDGRHSAQLLPKLIQVAQAPTTVGAGQVKSILSNLLHTGINARRDPASRAALMRTVQDMAQRSSAQGARLFGDARASLNAARAEAASVKMRATPKAQFMRSMYGPKHLEGFANRVSATNANLASQRAAFKAILDEQRRGAHNLTSATSQLFK